MLWIRNTFTYKLQKAGQVEYIKRQVYIYMLLFRNLRRALCPALPQHVVWPPASRMFKASRSSSRTQSFSPRVEDRILTGVGKKFSSIENIFLFFLPIFADSDLHSMGQIFFWIPLGNACTQLPYLRIKAPKTHYAGFWPQKDVFNTFKKHRNFATVPKNRCKYRYFLINYNTYTNTVPTCSRTIHLLQNCINNFRLKFLLHRIKTMLSRRP